MLKNPMVGAIASSIINTKPAVDGLSLRQVSLISAYFQIKSLPVE